MRVEIAVEQVADKLETEFWPLLADNNDEMATFKGLQVLAPDTALYRKCEEAGVFFGVVARDAGRVVGYSGTFIGPHPHYVHLVAANNNVLFLDKSYRGGLVTLRLMRATEAEAKRRGAAVIGWRAKPGSPLASMLVRLGYVDEETLYLQEL